MKLLLRASAGFLALFFCVSARAQDVRVNCSQNSTCTLTPAGGISWASGNQTWIFKPINPRVSVYIFIRNYNPTNAHNSQTIQVFQSPFSQDYAPSVSTAASKWTQDTVTQNANAGASCNNINALNDSSPGASGLGTCYVTTMFAAQVAIKITGAAAQAGSPDNFDLAIVQETGTPAGQQPGSSNSTLNPILQPATVRNGQNTSAANTAQNALVSAISGQRVYLFSLAVQASAAATCGVSVTDGATIIWQSDGAFVTTSVKTVTWPVPLASSVGNSMTVTVTPCGAGVTSTLSVQESQL
jgi:hypothetical protein